ncbi:MAG TPA: sulfatase [Actinomycetota bacterium]|nr:sulfatase [Actinomycetota bacterium]
MPDELPDIVLVVFDTARWDRFGCYGYGRPTTPTVDRLAEEGLRVETMIANGPWTLPAHGSLFTALYPSEHGSQWQTGPALRDSVPVTMAEWLRGLGYHTVCATNNGLISPRTRLSRGFDRYAFRLELERGLPRTLRRARKVLAGGDSGGRIVNRWVADELESVPRPLFLFVNYLECHWSYAPPRRLTKRVGGQRFGALRELEYRVRLADRVGPWEAVARADERTLAAYSTLYDGEVANVDDHLARLLDVLRSAGRLEEGRTLVIATSDHGEHLGEHGLADHHASVDDHLVRVPFVAWGPGLVPRRSRGGIFEFVDVLPSLARLLGRDLPDGVPTGRRTDLFSSGGGPNGSPYAFAEWRAWVDKERTRLARRNPSYDFTGLARDLVCVRDDRFKLVRASPGGNVLYDLAADPEEERDVSESHPEAAARLAAELDAAAGRWAVAEREGATLTEQESREIEQRLTELGYL